MEVAATKLHPVHDVYDGVFNSASGKIVSLIAPKPEQICLYDIAKGLSNICRFGGQVNQFYSVARHTLLVWYLAPERLKKVALLHDASEAYLGDVIKPLKVLIGRDYNPIEDKFSAAIFQKYNVDIALLPEIKAYDIAALSHEFNYLFRGDRYICDLWKAIDDLVGSASCFVQLQNLLQKTFGGDGI